MMHMGVGVGAGVGVKDSVYLAVGMGLIGKRRQKAKD
jgi:hypothetical protein